MFWPKGKHLVYGSTNLLKLLINLSSLFHNALNTIELPHPLITCIFQFVYTHPIDLMGIHLLHCVHGNECTWTPDALCDTFIAIAQDVGFHMGRKQLHVFLSNTFNSSRWRIDIVFNKNNICTLIDIVIVDPTRADLFPWSCATQGFVAFDAIQAKDYSYHNQHSIDQFLPLIVEVFGCLHK
jgi:hypothetical protein